MGTPIHDTEKGRRKHPGHPWATAGGGGWLLERARSVVELWKQMRAVIPILRVEKPIWGKNRRRMRPQKEHTLPPWPRSPPAFFQVLLAPTSQMDLRLHLQSALVQSEVSCGCLLMRYWRKVVNSGGAALLDRA